MFNQKGKKPMKKSLFLLVIGLLALVFVPTENQGKALDNQLIEEITVDVNPVNEIIIDFELLNPVNSCVEVEISPGDNYEGVIVMKNSILDNSQSEDCTYALNYDIEKRFTDSQFFKSCTNYDDTARYRQVAELNSDENRLTGKEVQGQPLSNPVFTA